MSEEKVERCSSAPVIKWLEIGGNIKTPPAASFEPIKQDAITPEKEKVPANRRTGSLRLRRHSSLTRGILNRIRTNSETDERQGEAKINTSISLNSSTERLHLSPNPGTSSPQAVNGAFFTVPHGSPNSVFDSPRSNSPEPNLTRCEPYPLRSRQQPGRQIFKPANTKSRKRSLRNSMDTDDGPVVVPSGAVKRIKLDLDWTDAHSVSPDSSTFSESHEIPLKSKFHSTDPQSLPPLGDPPYSQALPYDWWNTRNSNRIRRMSSESSISVDSITKEFNKDKTI